MKSPAFDQILPPLAQIFYVSDEFRAFQTSVPLARFLRSQRERLSAPTSRIDIIAHSLGALAANEAILQLPPGTVTSLAMIASAVPAESFTDTYIPDDVETSRMITAFFAAESEGFSVSSVEVDKKWR